MFQNVEKANGKMMPTTLVKIVTIPVKNASDQPRTIVLLVMKTPSYLITNVSNHLVDLIDIQIPKNGNVNLVTLLVLNVLVEKNPVVPIVTGLLLVDLYITDIVSTHVQMLTILTKVSVNLVTKLVALVTEVIDVLPVVELLTYLMENVYQIAQKDGILIMKLMNVKDVTQVVNFVSDQLKTIVKNVMLLRPDSVLDTCI